MPKPTIQPEHVDKAWRLLKETLAIYFPAGEIDDAKLDEVGAGLGSGAGVSDEAVERFLDRYHELEADCEATPADAAWLGMVIGANSARLAAER